jgi:hypothetical protein
MPGPTVVLLGMLTKIPVAGPAWLVLHYMEGLRRLGFDPWYVEAHARTPSMFMEYEDDNASHKAAGFVARIMRRYGFGDRWAFHALHEDGRVYGLSEGRLKRLYRSAELIVNLHGGTAPLPEHAETGRLVYLETDPVELEVEVYDGRQEAIDSLEQHVAFFTWGLNYGQPDCAVPLHDRLSAVPSPPPVLLDAWAAGPVRSSAPFTTVANWEQPWRALEIDGVTYHWSKHFEFLKVVDLPTQVEASLELALSSCSDEDRGLLARKGWRVRDALPLSAELDVYRDYIQSSLGEFSVAKEQNVRLRSGWFSERSATYLAAGRPVVLQDTGFESFLPVGEGLFSFDNTDEAAAAIETILSDPARHARAAREIAREFLAVDVVLRDLLRHVDAVIPATAARRA